MENSFRFPKKFFKTFIWFFYWIFSVIIGIGGGSLSVPLLKLHNFVIHKAIGTASGIGAFIAIPGTIGFVISGILNDVNVPLSVGYVNFMGLAMFTPMTMLAAPLGKTCSLFI